MWHKGLLFKVKHAFPNNYYLLFKSYFSDRYLQTKVGCATSQLHPITAGVPQSSVLGQILYLFFTADLPSTSNTILGTFADDTAILACHEDPRIASNYLQAHLNTVERWLRKWKTKVNESKSIHTTFTLRRSHWPPVTISNVPIPQSDQVRYLGLHLDKRLLGSTIYRRNEKK